jgi:hypothetical protein
MRRLIPLFAVLGLLGCQEDKVDQAAKCEFEAIKTYPNEHTGTSLVTGKFIELCMRAAGYNFEYTNSNCTTSLYGETELRNPFCYTSRDLLSRLAEQVEYRLKRPKKSN